MEGVLEATLAASAFNFKATFDGDLTFFGDGDDFSTSFDTFSFLAGDPFSGECDLLAGVRTFLAGDFDLELVDTWLLLAVSVFLAMESDLLATEMELLDGDVTCLPFDGLGVGVLFLD